MSWWSTDWWCDKVRFWPSRNYCSQVAIRAPKTMHAVPVKNIKMLPVELLKYQMAYEIKLSGLGYWLRLGDYNLFSNLKEIPFWQGSRNRDVAGDRNVSGSLDLGYRARMKLRWWIKPIFPGTYWTKTISRIRISDSWPNKIWLEYSHWILIKWTSI